MIGRLAQRLSSALASLAIVVGIAACGPQQPPSATATPEEISNERIEFQQDIMADVDKIDTFIQKTQRGANLSEFTLGWFTMILLNELSSQDAGLFAHFHADGMNVEYYLRHPFQKHPRDEIAALDTLAKDGGNPPARLAARHALEALTLIPDAKDPPNIQAQARKDLVVTLGHLKVALEKAAALIIPVPPQ